MVELTKQGVPNLNGKPKQEKRGIIMKTKTANPSKLKNAHTIELIVTHEGGEERLEGGWIKHIPSLYKYLKHLPDCHTNLRVGHHVFPHCEDPFCHYYGPCVCGLDELLVSIPGSPVQPAVRTDRPTPLDPNGSIREAGGTNE